MSSNATSHCRTLPFTFFTQFCHDDIVEMATACPELLELNFHLATIDVNLSSLILFTERLPHLRELTLPVDLSTLPRITKRSRRIGEQLLKLDMNHSSLGKSDLVTAMKHMPSVSLGSD